MLSIPNSSLDEIKLDGVDWVATGWTTADDVRILVRGHLAPLLKRYPRPDVTAAYPSLSDNDFQRFGFAALIPFDDVAQHQELEVELQALGASIRRSLLVPRGGTEKEVRPNSTFLGTYQTKSGTLADRPDAQSASLRLSQEQGQDEFFRLMSSAASAEGALEGGGSASPIDLQKIVQTDLRKRRFCMQEARAKLIYQQLRNMR